MRNSHKTLAVVVWMLALGTAAQAATIYQNTFDSAASLTGLTSYGSGSVSISGGQLTVGLSAFEPAGTGLNLAAYSPQYSSVLRSNPGTITWAVNVSNQDGGPNNSFDVVLACTALDPYGVPKVGYAFRGGGFVGNRMMLWRFDFGLGGGGSVVIDIPSANGLGTLPAKGSFKITYDPSNDNWSVFGQVGTSYVDPTSVSTLMGSGVDSTYTGASLPYFSMGGLSGGIDYFDNLSITVVPEPSILGLAAIGAVLLVTLKKKQASQ